MRKHLLYLKYILRHKWFVLIECAKRGILWRGLVHDLSKFLPSEWFAYADYFYGPETSGPLQTHVVREAFDRAWLLHQRRNPHHWQAWVLREDDGATKLIPMPEAYRKEMLADWVGAGKAQGYPSVNAWYAKNREKMKLHPYTRMWVEERLKDIP
jgi:hypothetical protein